MKILLNQLRYSEKFICLTNALHSVKGLNVGVVNGMIDDESVVSYRPDVIICDDEDMRSKYNSMKFVTILCKEDATGNQSIDLKQIGPCVDVSLFHNVSYKDKYKSDIVLFGDMKDFDGSLAPMLNGEYRIKVFHTEPVFTPFYCGVLPRDEYPSAYKSAICCPVSWKEDRSRDRSKFYEIVRSGGTPVVYKDGQKQKFLEDLKYLISSHRNNHAVTYEYDIDYSEYEKSTNTNRLSLALEQIGFTKLSNAIRKGCV